MAILLLCDQCTDRLVVHNSSDSSSLKLSAGRGGWVPVGGVWFCPEHAPEGGTSLDATGIAPQSNEDETPTRRLGCEEHNRLLEAFGAAVQDVLKLHQQQFSAIIQGDSECNRFDILIHMANEKKQVAKYAYLRHLESHGCTIH